MSAATALAALRAATHAAHGRLEALPATRRLMADDYTLPEYTRLLARFAAIYGHLEPLMQASEEAACIGYQARMPHLARALAALGERATGPDLGGVANAAWAGIPRGVDAPGLQTAAARWGCLYVVEGSMLGGQLIRKHLQGLFPTLPAAAFASFVPYDNPGQQWHGMRLHLEQALLEGAPRQQALNAALATYQLFYDGLQ